MTNVRLFVIIEGVASQRKPLTPGVPQDSIIGPILFLIYINDIDSDISADSLLHSYTSLSTMQSYVEL